jgi:NAD(P)-dependent dehydrogenase (short-subunit alcohol dehydrogenase family)
LGRIVFISSESAIQIPAEMIHYGMTKTAQLAIARGLAETTAGTNVIVNSVLPGPTASEGANTFVEELARDQKTTRREVEKQFFQDMRPTSLLKRMAEPKEVANLVTFVCSPLFRPRMARRCVPMVAWCGQLSSGLRSSLHGKRSRLR